MDRLLCPAVDGRLDSRLDRDELQLNIRGRKGASCVECACGTGSLTVPLSLAGLKMTGVDLSEQMLASAMIKARSRGCAIPFIRQNMVSLSLPSRVHAVLCTCDGLNYLTGDDAAAAENGVLYYPILVNHEAESWKRFLDEGLGRFLSGSFDGDYQRSLRDAFAANLAPKK